MTETTEPPEHRACRTATTPERRGVESALRQWRPGDSNAHNVYIGNEHVGVFFDPDLTAAVVRRMNDDPARAIAAEIHARYVETGERALLEAVAIAQRHAQTGPASTERAQNGSDAESGAGGSQATTAVSGGPPFDGAA